jgi:N-methylhydantoinase A
MASVLSAVGTLVTPARLDLARGGLCRIDAVDWDAVGGLIEDMVADGRKALLEAGLPEHSIAYDFSADMRYFGQQAEVTVRLGGDPRFARDARALRQRFDAAYEALYGVRLDDMDVEVVSWRTAAHGGDAGRDIGVRLAQSPARPKSRRQVWFKDRSLPVSVYERATLARDQRIDGPAIIEERETTIFLLAGWSLHVHPDGSLIAKRQYREV